MPKKVRTKYRKKNKGFQDEIKSIAHHFSRTLIEATFLESEGLTLSMLTKNVPNKSNIK